MKVSLFIGCLLLCAGCTSVISEPGRKTWQSPIGINHPITNTIIDTSTGRTLSSTQLIRHLAAADIILIGEIHNNADHHHIQAWIIDQLGSVGRTYGVVFEMISRDQYRNLHHYLANHPYDMSRLGSAIEWEKRGWPTWDIYTPIARAIINQSFTFVAGAPTKNTLKIARSTGVKSALSPSVYQQSGLHLPFPPILENDLISTLIDSHCGLIRSEQARKFLDIQRLKDGLLAARALEQRQGAIIIAGNEHVRRDRAVPWFIRQTRPETKTVSIGLIEVEPARHTTVSYTDHPYDIVWFTPALPKVDHCEQFKANKEKLQNKHPAQSQKN